MREAAGGGSAPPNQGGSRVVNLPKSRRTRTATSMGDAQVALRPARSLILVGALVAPLSLASLLTAAPRAAQKEKNGVAFDYEGDAVTAPELETTMLALTEAGASVDNSPQFFQAVATVNQLEAQGGPQLFAAKAPGRWVLPQVGGWERIWVSEPAARFPGAPSRPDFALDASKGEPALRAGSALFSLSSARQFIYGPGEGGMVVEYLHSAPGAEKDLLLTHLADIRNLGGNFFEVEFRDQLKAYAATKDAVTGSQVLARKEPLEGAFEFGAPRGELATLQTTYLSATMWVIRDEQGRKAVFSRTEVKSVADRRGVQAEGQVKEHPDEETRYGKLLFGETLSEYAGWEENVEKTEGSSRIKGLLGGV